MLVDLSPTDLLAALPLSPADTAQEQLLKRELCELQDYNRGLTDSNLDALITTDTLGIISDVNRRMCEMTGATRETLIGSSFKTHFTDSQLAETGMRQVLAEDRVTDFELTLLSVSGHTTLVSFNAATFRGASSPSGIGQHSPQTRLRCWKLPTAGRRC